MQLIDLDGKKKIAYQILADMAKLCDQHGIRYFLAYGTLLGAVRHKGFIPWDDDVDLFVMGQDYLKFLKIMKEESPYHVLSSIDSPQWPMSFSKIGLKGTKVVDRNPMNGIVIEREVAIDVFPLYPYDQAERFFLFKVKYARMMSWRYTEKEVYREYYKVRDLKTKGGAGELVKKLLFGLDCHLLRRSRGYWNCRLLDMCCAYDEKRTMPELAALYSETEVFSREDFEETDRLPFEEGTFAVPHGWDHILTVLYGDYMTPPPEEERVPIHDTDDYYL